MDVVTKLAPGGTTIVEHDRDYFRDNIWLYQPGERVSILGPSGAGKTVLLFQLVESTMADQPKIMPVAFVSKPRDLVVEEWGRGLHLKTVRDWPPRVSIWESTPPPGYVLWPPEDPEDWPGTIARQHAVFTRALNRLYNFHKLQKGKPKEKKLKGTIAIADELQAICDELRLEELVIRHYSRGRSNDAGMWGASQLPIDLPGIVYSSADHLFLAYMPDARYRKRFAEIGGGIDAQLVEQATLQLRQYEWLYIRRSDRSMCIVRA